MTNYAASEVPTQFAGEPCDLMWRVVWSVDRSRADLYVVTSENTDVLVQLVDGGIANRPGDILGIEMPVLVSAATGKVIALPVQDSSGWKECKRLRD